MIITTTFKKAKLLDRFFKLAIKANKNMPSFLRKEATRRSKNIYRGKVSVNLWKLNLQAVVKIQDYPW